MARGRGGREGMAAEEKERQRKGMTKEMTQEEIRSRIAEYREWMIGVRLSSASLSGNGG